MITEIGNILKSRIISQPYVDRIAGIVMTMIEEQVTDENTFIKKFPVSCDISGEDCSESNSRYKDLIPNSNKKSVIYFEDLTGITFLSRERDNLLFQCSPRMIGWLNLTKLGRTECSISSLIVPDIIDKLITISPFNTATFNRVSIKVNKQVPKTAQIFNKYTFLEKETQYLMYPYDYFALDLTVNFAVNKNCIADFAPSAEDECNTQ